MRRFARVIPVLLLLLISISAYAIDIQYASGFVYNDINKNSVRDPGETGLPDVKISNGREIVKTDSEGRYRLSVDDDTTIFVIKPSGWKTRLDGNNLPRYYYIHKPAGSPQLRYKGVDPTGPLPASIDIPLYQQKEPEKFDVIFFGDTQPHNQEQVDFLAHDIIEEVAGTSAAFGVTLGDVGFDRLDLYDTLVPIMGLAGIPWYHVKGNHDTNYDASSRHKHTDETWERVFGPSYYSFDYGPVHFISLNNPYFGDGGKYKARLDRKQMIFLRNDLSLVPKDQLVVLMMHIPITGMSDQKQIYDLLEGYNYTFSISGHTHDQKHVFITADRGWKGSVPHHHLVNATTCGPWWGGNRDEVGIPHATMNDGTPNGYTIATFDKNSYSLKYKVARRPADYQMNVYTPDEVAVADLEKTNVIVNVFSGSDKSTVEMQVGSNGAWTVMEKVRDKDPFYARMKEVEKQKIPDTDLSLHLWKAPMPKGIAPGTYFINVRTTDMFGQVFTGRRAVRVR